MYSKIALLALVASAQAGYWEFCNTPDGKDCGEGVSTGNDGCLKESGRQSLHVTSLDGGLYFPVLIGYSDDNCQHEVGCNTVGADGAEQDINFTKNQVFKWALGAKSFKFQSGSPPKCPNGCNGSCGPSKRSRVEAADYVKRTPAEPMFTKRQGGGNFWFCDDDNCSKNCGAKIEPNSEGCANNEGGRKSVYFKGTGSDIWQLGAYNNGDCTGAPVTTVHAKQGCNKLPSQHDSWQTVGVNS